MLKRLENMTRNFFRKTNPSIINEEKLYGPYLGRGGYLAIRDNWSEVVAHSTIGPLDVLEKAYKNGYEKGTIMCIKTPDILPLPHLILVAA